MEENTEQEIEQLRDELVQATNTISSIEERLKRAEYTLAYHKHLSYDNSQLLNSEPEVSTLVSYTTVGSSYAPEVGSYEMIVITAQDANVTFSNPTDDSENGQKILIRIQDNGSARTISWGSEYRATTVSLPTTTVANKYTYIGFMRNTDDTKWDLLASVVEA